MDPAALKPYQNAENIAAAATGMTLDYMNMSSEHRAADIIYRVVVHKKLWVHRHVAIKVMVWSGVPCLEECHESS